MAATNGGFESCPGMTFLGRHIGVCDDATPMAAGPMPLPRVVARQRGWSPCAHAAGMTSTMAMVQADVTQHHHVDRLPRIVTERRSRAARFGVGGCNGPGMQVCDWQSPNAVNTSSKTIRRLVITKGVSREKISKSFNLFCSAGKPRRFRAGAAATAPFR